MSMMIARAPHGEVYAALERAIEEEDLVKVMELPNGRKMELHKGINLFTYGDEITVHLVEIDPVMVVHIQSCLREGNPQLFVWRHHHLKLEQRLLETMMGVLGEDRCSILG